jgi:hypothetical protein
MTTAHTELTELAVYARQTTKQHLIDTICNNLQSKLAATMSSSSSNKQSHDDKPKRSGRTSRKTPQQLKSEILHFLFNSDTGTALKNQLYFTHNR